MSGDATDEPGTQQDSYSVGEKDVNVVTDGDELFIAARQESDDKPQVMLLRDYNARELYEQLEEVFGDD